MEGIALYYCALGNKEQAVSEIKSALFKLQPFIESKDDVLRNAVTALMQHYFGLLDKLKANQRVLSLSDTYIHLGSKVGECFFYPQFLHDMPYLPFNVPEGTKLYTDPDGPMSTDGIGPVAWKRIPECVSVNSTLTPRVDLLLYQDALADCSVVSALLSLAAWELRTGNTIAPEIWNPRDGLYYTHLYFNGAFRTVVVDDQLPVLTQEKFAGQDRSLFVRSANTDMIYPCLIEKMVLKVLGGYGFSGSHTAADTYMLINWIPECLVLGSRNISDLWISLCEEFDRGNVLISVGTGSKSSSKEYITPNLINNHDYAVLGVDKVNRKLQIRNPWHRDNRTDWVDWSTVFIDFQAVYLNWNPSIYHALQPTSFASSLSGNRQYSDNPQYVIQNNSSNLVRVRILVTHHDVGANPLDGFLSMRIVKNRSSKIVSPAELQGSIGTDEMNTPYQSFEVEISPNSSNLLIVLCSSTPPSFTKIFSLNLYLATKADVTYRKAQIGYADSAALDGYWVNEFSGGPIDKSTYLSNPQIRLTLHTDSEVVIYLLMKDGNLCGNLALFKTNEVGDKVRSVTSTNLIGSSGNYSNIPSPIVATLRAGKYVLVASTYSSGEAGQFTVLTHCNSKVELHNIYYGTHLFRTEVTKHWGHKTKITIPLSNSSEGETTLHCHSILDKDLLYRPHIRLSLFQEGKLLKSSSPNFENSVYGVYMTTNLMLGTKYTCLVERMEPGAGSFLLVAEANGKLKLGSKE